jgi:hypothetical protein
MKSRSQKPEARSQKAKAETASTDFVFILTPDFWILNAALTNA